MAWFSLIVTSDRVYRGEREDKITPMVREFLEWKGHYLAYNTIVPNNHAMIRNAVLKGISMSDVTLVTGGTGLSRRDISIDVVESIADRIVPGFGELHRLRSLESVGERSILSRTSAFMIGSKLVAVSPGNPDAVRIALEILVEIADHIREIALGASHWDKPCHNVNP